MKFTTRLICWILIFAFLAGSAPTILPRSYAAEDWRSWAQSDSRWGSTPLGTSSATMSSAGCLITSLAKVMVQSGLVDPDTFTPGTLITRLNSIHTASDPCFTSGGGFYWKKAEDVLEGFKLENYSYGLTGKSSDCEAALLDLVRAEYHILLNVGGHYVAVDNAKSLSSNHIYIMDTLIDTSKNTDVLLTSRYSQIYQVSLYSGWCETPGMEYIRDYCTEKLPCYLYVTTATQTTLWSIPCSDQTSPNSEALATAPSGATYTADMIYRNSEGDYWYRIRNGSQVCYLFSGDTSGAQQIGAEPTVSALVTPETISEGKSFNLSGTISSPGLPISEVGAYIYQGCEVSGDIHMMILDDAGPFYSINIKSSPVNQKLKFGQLAAGTYTYLMTVVYDLYSATGNRLSHTRQVQQITENVFTVTNTEAEYDPQGLFEEVSVLGSQVRVSGWAFDRSDTSQSLEILVSINGIQVGTLTAGSERTDLKEIYPSAGIYHGFAGNVPAPDSLTGTVEVELIAKNIHGGSDASLGKKTVTLSGGNPGDSGDHGSLLGSGNCGASGTDVTWAVYSDGTLIISGSGAMYDYTDTDENSAYIRAPWKSGDYEIRTVVVEPGVTHIGIRSFTSLSMVSVSIPDTVVTIGANAFASCDKLNAITIPDSVTEIGDSAFEGCSALQTVTIPDSVAILGQAAFRSCKKLRDVTLSGSITSLNPNVFYNCTSLTHIVIPGSISTIGYGAFENCTGLTRVEIPYGTTEIASYAFSGCTGLTDVTISNSVTGISSYAFDGCVLLSEITIPNSVETISAKAFRNCTAMTTASIGNNVEFIGNNAFAGCVSLEQVYMGRSVRLIDSSAFLSCSSLSDVYYSGTQEQWAAINFTSGNDALRNARLHTDIQQEKTYDIRYFYGWNEREQRVYFGPDDLVGCLVTEETDSGFRNNPTLMLRRYVIVETKMVNGEEILLDMILPLTKMGVVTAVTGQTITIDNVNYDIPANLANPNACLDKTVMYHIADGVLAGVNVLQEKEGFLTYWQAEGSIMRLEPYVNSGDSALYQLSACATEASAIFLEWAIDSKTNTTDATVTYLTDGNRVIFHIQPYVEYRENGFSEDVHGWPLANTGSTFGYPTGYTISPWVYYAHGYSVGAILRENINDLLAIPWGGNCFGLSLLAVAQYHEQVDLAPYFDKTGDALNQFGYTSIDSDNGKNGCVLYEYRDGALVLSSAIIQKIEQAQLSYYSSDIGDIEVSVNHFNIGETLLDHLNGSNPEPLVIGLHGQYGHAVVTDTTMKPIYLGNGRFLIPVYDCNAPQAPAELENPWEWYGYDQSMVYIDTQKMIWNYLYNGSFKYTYQSLRTNPLTIYDTTMLDDSFFNDQYSIDSEQVILTFDLGITGINHMEVFRVDSETGTKTTVYEMNNNVSVLRSEGVVFRGYLDTSDSDTTSTGGILILPMGDYIIVTDGEAYIQCMYDNNIFVAGADSRIELALDTANDRMTVVAAEDSTAVACVHASSEVDFATSVDAVMTNADVLTLSVDADSQTATVTTTVEADAVTVNHAVDGDLGKITPDMIHAYEPIVTAPTCAAQGYTTYRCKDCSDSYVGNYVDAVGHSYEDNQCIWCGKSLPTARFTSISTSLGGNIAMNFYAELSADLVAAPDAYIRFSFAGQTLEVPVSEGVATGNGIYRFSCPITSKNMTDDITAQFFCGDIPVGVAKSMAVDTYCNWVIANYTDTKTINLMKAMLNYGASAQLLFSYRTDDLANAALSEADKTFGKVDASAFAHSVTGSEAGIKPTSCTLMLDSETAIRVYFQLTGDKTIDQYTFKVDGVEVTPVYKDGKYYIEKSDIGAHRLDEMHTFTCGGITITYGGLSYVNQVMGYYTSGTTFNMASALYAYSRAAEAYIG